MNIQFNQHPTPKCKAWLLYFFGALLRLSYGLSFLKEKQMVFSYFIFHGTKRVESKRYKVKWVGTGDGWFNQNWFGWDGDSMFSEFSHRLQFNLSYLFLTSFQPVILCRHREGKFAVSQVPWMWNGLLFQFLTLKIVLTIYHSCSNPFQSSLSYVCN